VRTEHTAQDTVRDVYTVSRLNRTARDLLEASLPLVWIEGEISNLARPASGHLYFTLKDAQAQVRCALFRGQMRSVHCEPRNGMQVLARARVSLYEGRGEFQLLVQYLEEAGEGALRRRFEELKARLAAEGLFDPSRKRPLPAFPRRVGVITSPTGAAIRDVLTTLRRRFPALPVLVYPVPVQGEGAAARIATAIELASRRAECDCLILARGGGSLEDLWSFNEEIVARALAACTIPVVCGVGHEIDFTIADFAADHRAPTPTAAAAMVSPDAPELLAALLARGRRLRRDMDHLLGARIQRVDWLARRLVHPRERLAARARLVIEATRRLAAAERRLLGTLNLRLMGQDRRLHGQAPGRRLAMLAGRVATARGRLASASRRDLAALRERLAVAARALDALSPLATLARGFALVQRADDGTVVSDASQVSVGDRVTARLANGRLGCTVTEAGE